MTVGPRSARRAMRAAVVPVLAAHGIVVEGLTVLEGGFGGVNLRADTPRGPLVVKLRDDPRKLLTIRAVSAVLATRRVPHPAVLVPPTETGAGWLIGVEWIAGGSLEGARLGAWSAAEAARLGADLGGWLRQLHGLRLVHRPWRERAGHRLADKLGRCVREGLVDADLAAGVEAFWAAGRDALDGVPITLVHRDLQPGNILVDGRRFAAVIDFEQAWLADPLYDFVKLRQWVFPLHPAVGPALEDAYGLRPQMKARLVIVSVLEYLSAIVYFHRHGNPAMVAEQRARLTAAVGSSGFQGAGDRVGVDDDAGRHDLRVGELE